MLENDLERCKYRNRHDHAHDPRELSSHKQSKNNGQRMHMQRAADDLRKNDISLK